MNLGLEEFGCLRINGGDGGWERKSGGGEVMGVEMEKRKRGLNCVFGVGVRGK